MDLASLKSGMASSSRLASTVSSTVKSSLGHFLMAGPYRNLPPAKGMASTPPSGIRTGNLPVSPQSYALSLWGERLLKPRGSLSVDAARHHKKE